MIFKPTETFFSPEMNSEYVEGLTYTVRPGNEKLAKQVAKWVKEHG